MEENNQKVAGATEKMTNQELVKEIKNKEEEIVMNDKKEVKETVVAGGEKAPIIPEDMIGDFEEEINQEEMKKLEKEFNKTVEPIGAEVREKIKEIQEKELEQERLDGLAEMQESLKENKTDNKKVKQQTDVITADMIKPPMNMSSVLNEIVQKQDINKRKSALQYLSNAKDSITRTLDYNGKLHWSKEEITLLRRVRAISNELGTIIDILKVIPKQQEEMKEIQQQLEQQPIANIKVEYVKGGEFSVINTETKVIETTGNKDEIKGYLKALYKA